MKLSRLFQALAGAAALGFGANASAIPVTFDLADGPESSVSVTSLNTDDCWCNVSVALNSSLDSLSSTLSAGDSWEFDFFSIDFDGLGDASGTLGASLGFDAPAGAPNADGSASGNFWSAFLFSGGDLSWTTQPGSFSLADGTSYSVQFLDLTGITWGSMVNVRAVLTLDSEPAASVPEPGTLALFGMGLLGIGFAARRRRA